MTYPSALVPLLVLFAAACGNPPSTGSLDGGTPADLPPTAVDLPPSASRIEHLVVIVQENHTFDNYFGRYCTAPPGSNPTCTTGPACCEAGPDKDPGTGGAPAVLDDAAAASYDPNHTQMCEVDEIDGGKMDHFVSSTYCGSAKNFAYVAPEIIKPYLQYAGLYAIADRYFQPIIGQSSSNDMYLARAGFVFTDNSFEPDAKGKTCSTATHVGTFSDQTIADLLIARGVTWAWYSEGYQAMLDALPGGSCPLTPVDCAGSVPFYPCVYDPGDVPFEYYPSLTDNPKYMKDYDALAHDLANGTLPQVSYVKGLGYHTEHPGLRSKLSDGVHFVTTTVDAIMKSSYASSTLVLLTYDEGGGYFDHVPPPPASKVDGKSYGTRVPLIAMGPFVNKNYVSHATLEHSSIVKFIEWNWLGQMTGQLHTRDTEVKNLGSLLDPATTGTPVPQD